MNNNKYNKYNIIYNNNNNIILWGSKRLRRESRKISELLYLSDVFFE